MVASRLRAVKASGQLRNLLTFLVFVAMAALFWLSWHSTIMCKTVSM